MKTAAPVVCPRTRADAPWLRSEATGTLVPPSCRAWLCPVCGPRKACRIGRALDSAGYDRAITLTAAPRDFRQGAARVAHLLRKEFGRFEWCWAMERGDDTGMHHLHAAVRSGYVEQSRLSELAADAGWGAVAWIERATGVGDYGSKWARYVLKGVSEWEACLAANGGKRTWHWSRGYTEGVPMRTWVPRHAPARDPGPWGVVPHYVIDRLVDALCTNSQPAV